jgi:cobalt-zinc-cadmium resistance protein CzcA
MIWAGEFEDLQQAKERLEIIVPVSLLLILGLLYCLFNSLRSASDAGGIPFAVAGGVLALYVSGLLQHLRRHRLRLAVWRVGHERHSA